MGYRSSPELKRAYESAYMKRYRQTPAGQRRRRNTILRHKYGITLVVTEVLLAAQGGRCPICQREINLTDGDIDHDHKTKAVRGILCQTCNRGLGQFKDNAEWLDEATCYIRRHSEEQR